jgi:hypothetical protein
MLSLQLLAKTMERVENLVGIFTIFEYEGNAGW